jgi:hypothetical protein
MEVSHVAAKPVLAQPDVVMAVGWAVMVYPVTSVGAMQSVWVHPLTVYAWPAALHAPYAMLEPVYPVAASQVTPDGFTKLSNAIFPPVTEPISYPAVFGAMQSVGVHPLTVYAWPTAVHAPYVMVEPVYPAAASHTTPVGANEVRAKDPDTDVKSYPVVLGCVQSVCAQPDTVYAPPESQMAYATVPA